MKTILKEPSYKRITFFFKGNTKNKRKYLEKTLDSDPSSLTLEACRHQKNSYIFAHGTVLWCNSVRFHMHQETYGDMIKLVCVSVP